MALEEYKDRKGIDMELKIKDINKMDEWGKIGISAPGYDVNQMREKTEANPIWIHFGAGNIFRGFIAGLQNELLNNGIEEKGIIAVETFDHDIIDQIYHPFDNLTLNVGLKKDGNLKMDILASIASAYKVGCGYNADWESIRSAFLSKELQMVSFTITEKGYALYDMNKEMLPVVCMDIENGPGEVKHAMSIVTSLLFERFSQGQYPVALCSMDNCSENGEKIKTAVMTIAREWEKKGFVTKAFIDYLCDESKITFPWSMIDKITPSPANEVEKRLEQMGVTNMNPVVTSKNTRIAPFVNAEIPQYLVIEDKFPNGRPKLEKAGVFMTDRDTVNKMEKMKVMTCLNPLHTAMAVFGCLLGYNHIAKEMKDEDIKKLVELIGYSEGLPVVINPGIIQPMDFIKEVIEERLPNPYIPDMPQRIATDTSMKIPIRFGETIKAYAMMEDKDVTELTGIPLVIAAWFRYLLGLDDNLEKMEISPDPMAGKLQELLKDIKVGNPQSYHGQLKEILTNDVIFGIDLCKIGLDEKIEKMFIELLIGKNAVRKTLHSYVMDK